MKISSFYQSILCFPPSPDRKRQIWSDVLKLIFISLHLPAPLLSFKQTSSCLREALAVLLGSISICLMSSFQI